MRIAFAQTLGSTGRAARLAALCCCLMLAASIGAVSADYQYGKEKPGSLKYAPLHFSPPEPVKKVLPNGMTLYLIEDHELPLFNAMAYIKTGSIYDPADKAGLAQLTGTVMRTGGTTERTGDELDAALEFVGGTVETSIDTEYGTASVSTLQKDADTGLEILAGVLRRPAFRQDKLELAKQQMAEAIRRKNDEPSEIAERLFTQTIYGADSPWAREPTLAGLAKITRQDLVDFHARYFAPNNIILAVAGDMSTDAMEEHIRRWFGDWQSHPVELPEVAPVPDKVAPGVYLAPKETNQANIRMGHVGIRRHLSEQYAVRVMNYILGTGGFSSRLMSEVRTNRGLAYSVWGYLGQGTDRGLFEMGAETKVETTGDAVAAMRQTLNTLVREPVSEAELAAAKEAMINSFIFQYQSRFQIVSQRAMLDMLGYPPDYLATYPQRIAAVTTTDVQHAAQQFLHPDSLVILVVGPQEKLAGPLAAFGPVKTLPLAVQ